MSRASSKKKKSNILKLKFLSEEKNYAEEELDIGTTEIKEILQEFSKKVIESQKKSFDNFFFGVDEPQTPAQNSSSSHELAIAKSGKSNDPILNSEKPKWVKDLYKKIVQRSHPDKYVGFGIEEIKEKFTRVYMSAVKAFEELDIGMILLCAYDVEIDISKVEESEKYINESIVAYEKRIQDISSLIGYQWYHLSEKNRLMFLKNYLLQLGYKFDSEKAKDVIEKNKKSRISRKTGTRPEKIRVNKGKIK